MIDRNSLSSSRFIGALALFACVACSAFAQTKQAQTEKLIEDAMAKAKPAGVTVAVFVDGKFAFAKGFGSENIEDKRTATEKTVIRLASISKSFTAALIMNLVEDGKIDLDADARKYVPQFPKKDHVFTVRQLLSHTSGIRHYSGVGDATGNVTKHFDRAIDACSLFSSSPLLFEPGTKYSYSTHAYTILAAVVESVTGKSFEDAFNSFYGSKLEFNVGIENLKREANHHRSQIYRGAASGPMKHLTREDNSWKYAGGGVEANAIGVALFGSKLLNGSLLKPASVKALWTNFKLKDGKETGYGLGFDVSPNGRVGHSGGQQGSRTGLMIDPKSKVVVAVLCNTDGAFPSYNLASEIVTVWSKP